MGFAGLSDSLLDELKPFIRKAVSCTTVHPSARTWIGWLQDAGFGEVKPTHAGNAFARRLLDRLDSARRPADLEGVDALLRPAVEAIVGLPAPLEDDPPLTALR
jgi:hypothetical protein